MLQITKLSYRRVVAFGLPVCVAVLFTACGSTPKAKGGGNFTQEDILNMEDVKKKEPVVMAHPLDQVREAAQRALTQVGCEVKKTEPYMVAGRRPNKFGLFVGSGGETVKVFLLPSGDAETKVWVDTDLSFVGIAGQQGWDNQVISAMKEILSEGK